MNIRKVFLLLCLLFLGDLFFACCRCRDSGPVPYSHCILNSDNMELIDERYVPSPSAEIEAHLFGLSVTIQLKEYVCHRRAKALVATTAMACSCDEPFGQALNQISELNIYTLHNYDSISPAGSNVTAYFSMVRPGVFDLPLGNAPQYLNTESEYLSFKGILLSLNNPPDNSEPQSFILEISLTDGRIISDTTSAVRLI